jgi:hypothetical protein
MRDAAEEIEQDPAADPASASATAAEEDPVTTA